MGDLNIITEADRYVFGKGCHYEIYRKLGSHLMELGGKKGVYFAVWAPNANAVSVIGDFNDWNKDSHGMEVLGESGIWEIFVPGAKKWDRYKYVIETESGDLLYKADPYAFHAEVRPGNASKVADIDGYTWHDAKWLEKQEKENRYNKPMAIYEMHLGSWRKDYSRGEDGFLDYKTIADELIPYLKEMGYTHVELIGVAEHPFDGSWGYQVTGYYAPTARYGSPEDFAWFMNYMHEQGIAVILDWVPAHFPKDEFGLAKFDGTCLYEHADPRQGEHPHWGTLIYNYARPEVKNFLIANALFWAEQYHADGIRMDAVASMLYLDYGKNDGEWVANIYGGNENLDAVSFLKELNTQFKKRKNGAVVIAEESTAWPMVTGSPEEGLGFDFKWNMGWMNDFTGFMQCDPYFRKDNYNQLTFSMIYAYSENFVLVLSHDEVVHGKGSMIQKMPGAEEILRFSNLRAAYTFMYMHPGKKLLFMGQEFAEYREWSEERELDWASLDADKHMHMQDFVRELNRLYQTEPALYKLDQSPEGFEWINNTTYLRSICAFIRKTENPEDTLLVFCNFDTIPQARYKFGVPYPGTYKEILNSDDDKYDGYGMVNTREITAKEEECDGREHSISIKMGPVSVSVWKYVKQEEEERKEEKNERKDK